VRQLWIRFSRNQDGATAVEYGALIALIAMVIIGAVVMLDIALTDQWRRVLAAIT
jgi:Flp pilus assembly pilin Flp